LYQKKVSTRRERGRGGTHNTLLCEQKLEGPGRSQEDNRLLSEQAQESKSSGAKNRERKVAVAGGKRQGHGDHRKWRSKSASKHQEMACGMESASENVRDPPTRVENPELASFRGGDVSVRGFAVGKHAAKHVQERTHRGGGVLVHRRRCFAQAGCRRPLHFLVEGRENEIGCSTVVGKREEEENVRELCKSAAVCVWVVCA
jgi:hypothetical protein